MVFRGRRFMDIDTSIPDIQSSKPLYSIPIDRVSVKGVYRRICLKGVRGSICFDARIDLAIDLPKEQRGIHVSRNIEATLDVFKIIEYDNFKTLEEATERLCRELLSKHSYASNAEVVFSTTFLYDYADKSLGLVEHIPVKLSIRSKISRENNKISRRICIEVIGMTVCPCALQVCRHVLNLSSYAPSHTQRARLRLCIDTHQESIDIGDVIEIALSSFSTPVFSHLKREKECKLILKGFENTKFAEDVVRETLYSMYKKFSDKLSGDTVIYIDLRSFESIHPFDLYVSAKYRLGELAKLLESG